MGLFSNATPFDSDVEKITDEKKTDEDWGMIMDFCDRVQATKDGPRDCLKSIMKQLNHTNPHVQLKAITLLDAVVNNCGKPFRLEIASSAFESDYRKLLGNRSHQQVQEKLKAMLRSWAEGDFKGDPQLSLIPSLYNQLKKEGITFSSSSVSSQTRKKHSTSAPKDPNVVSNQQEEDDIAKAIQLSLQESKSSPSQQAQRSASYSNSTTSSSNANQAGLYPSANAPMDLGSFLASTAGSTSSPGGSNATSKEEKKARALYDFEAAEDNELTFKAGEIVIIIDDSDTNWWKGSNHRGEGLFPANFVTNDLEEEPAQFKEEKQKNQRRRSVTFNEEVEVATLHEESSEATKQPSTVAEVSEGKIDQVMSMLNEADPTLPESDPAELAPLEHQVNGMGPLIDAELELVDRRHAQLTRISTELVDALNLYHQLMHEGQPMQQHPGYGMGIPGQFQIPTANHAPMYMPHMPGGATSSPQHQPQIYQQNLNHPAIPTMHGAMQPGQSFPATTGTAPIYPHGFSSPNQQPVAGNPIPAHVNGPPADQQHSIMTSGPGNAPSPGTIQANSNVSAPTTATLSHPGSQGMSQQIDSQYTNISVAAAMNHQQQSFVPNGSHPQENSNPYANGAVPPIQTHGMAPQQALPPMN